ncbi:conserved hypothetical protein, partial [Ixodes scapularis]
MGPPTAPCRTCPSARGWLAGAGREGRAGPPARPKPLRGTRGLPSTTGRLTGTTWPQSGAGARRPSPAGPRARPLSRPPPSPRPRRTAEGGPSRPPDPPPPPRTRTWPGCPAVAAGRPP